MDKRCDVFEDFRMRHDRGCTEAERRDFDEHLVHCPACRDQWTSEKALENLFSEATPPVLSPSFNEKLRLRISEEREKRPHRPILMQAYWLAACLVSMIIFLKTSGKSMDSGATVMLIFLCFVAPTLLLGRMLRFNLFDLILSTMNHTERRVDSYHN